MKCHYTGSQKQEIATITAKAEVTREGKKYGNLQQHKCFDNYNQHLNNKV